MKPIAVKLCIMFCLLALSSHAFGQTETRIFSLTITEEQYADPPAPGIPSFEQQEDYLEILRQRGGIIRRRSHSNLTKDQVRGALTSISTPVLLFLFRGRITRSAVTNRVYLLPVDAIPNDVSTYISLAELNQWMQGIPQQILLLDTYTQDTDLMAFYGNREVVGTSALISIHQQNAIGEPFASVLLQVLESDTTDADNNRQIELREVYQAMLDQFSHPGILAPTGQMNAVLMQLTSRLLVRTEPEAVSVWVNDEVRGVTPYIQDGIYPGNYRIRLEKEGFHRPEEISLSVGLARGEGANVEQKLDPIRIRGKAHDDQNRGIVPTIVQLSGTDYAVEADENGEFAFEDAQLEAGKNYTLLASAGEGIFVGEQAFAYGGFDDIFQNILMRQRPWLEIAQERFQNGQVQDAADKFRLAVEENYELPLLPPDFALMAFEYAEEWARQQPDVVSAVLAAAQLAEQRNQIPVAKRYWKLARRRADENSSEYQFAAQRLKALTPWRIYILIGGAILLTIIGISGGYMVYRHRSQG